jgi:hypothetical protein
MPPEENVTYTPQKEVYNILFQLLDQAITELHQENLPAVSQYDLGDNDKCYGGDVDKWRRFANTLRLRLALRVSNVDPALAQTQAKAALTDPAGLMQSQDDNMKRSEPSNGSSRVGGVTINDSLTTVKSCLGSSSQKN